MMKKTNLYNWEKKDNLEDKKNGLTDPLLSSITIDIDNKNKKEKTIGKKEENQLMNKTSYFATNSFFFPAHTLPIDEKYTAIDHLIDELLDAYHDLKTYHAKKQQLMENDINTSCHFACTLTLFSLTVSGMSALAGYASSHKKEHAFTHAAITALIGFFASLIFFTTIYSIYEANKDKKSAPLLIENYSLHDLKNIYPDNYEHIQLKLKSILHHRDYLYGEDWIKIINDLNIKKICGLLLSVEEKNLHPKKYGYYLTQFQAEPDYGSLSTSVFFENMYHERKHSKINEEKDEAINSTAMRRYSI